MKLIYWPVIISFGYIRKKEGALMKIGIAGAGMVGGSLAKCFDNPIIYDPYKGLGSKEELNSVEIIFVAVPTPTIENSQDLSSVTEVLEIVQDNKIVVIKSTILPGTTEKLQEEFPKLNLLFNPEFLTETTAETDTKNPTRQIVGYTDKSKEYAETVLKVLPKASFQQIVPATVAEFIKYYSNTFYSTKVAFNNQMYDLAKKVELEDEEWSKVIEAVNADKMIGKNHLNIWHKGFRGYGGKCLPKDTKALIGFAKNYGYNMWILETADAYNDELTRHVERVQE